MHCHSERIDLRPGCDCNGKWDKTIALTQTRAIVVRTDSVHKLILSFEIKIRIRFVTDTEMTVESTK